MKKIDTDIPLPMRRYSFSRHPEIAKLEIKESVWYTDEEIGNRARFHAHVSNMKKQTKKEFTTRTTIEKGVKGVRVWRVS